MMIHEGMIGLMGYLNAPKLRKYADEIEKITDSVIVPAYERSMQTVDEIKEMMAAETWLSAEDAVEIGFADEIEEGKAVAAYSLRQAYLAIPTFSDLVLKLSTSLLRL